MAMNATRCGLVVAVVTLAACSNSPTAPTPPAVVAAAPPLVIDFPVVARPARIYVNSALYRYLLSTTRFVLYDDGTFTLQFLNNGSGIGEYRGTYKEANGTVDFDWEGWSVMGPWDATASLTPDALTVSYNDIMKWNDFEDGVYDRAR